MLLYSCISASCSGSSFNRNWGDCFCIFYSNKDKKVVALNGSGNLPSKVNYDSIIKTEDNLIDPYSHSAITYLELSQRGVN